MNFSVFRKRLTIIFFSLLILVSILLAVLSTRSGCGILYIPKMAKGFIKEMILRSYGPQTIPAHKFIVPSIKLTLKAITNPNNVSCNETLLGFDIHYLAPQSFLFGFYEIFFREIYYFKSDTSSPFILDCGANIGMATLYFKMIYPQSEIIAFEPSSACCAIIKKNIKNNNLAKVTVLNKAVSNKKGYCSFWDPSHGQGDGRASILVSSPDCTKVETVLLSDYITKPVDLLKIDIEGSEHNVLQDLVASGKIDMIKQLILEYHHHIPNNTINRLGNFLSILEHHNFGYQIRSCGVGIGLQYDPNEAQLMIIHAYKINKKTHI